MAMKQSASKEEFLKKLGLDPSKQEEKSKFQQMWEEVTQYWVQNFETTDRAILKPEYAVNSAVQRPYKWAHLSPQVIDHAINQIWRNAGYWPRHYYNQGATDDHRVYNWVLKWLLWHVCRYRDWRNRKSRTSSVSTCSSSSTPPAESSGPENTTEQYWRTIMN